MFKIEPLNYNLDALEPVISKEIMELHYHKHYQGYTDKFNKFASEEGVADQSIEQIFTQISNYSQSLINNAGGHYNHKFFWQCLTPPESEENKISDTMLSAIEQSFGSFEAFKSNFIEQATGLFGSGWVNLVQDKTGQLKIVKTYNQDAISMDFVQKEHGVNKLLLNLDVWEHAYYIDYQNRRAEYAEKFFDIIN